MPQQQDYIWEFDYQGYRLKFQGRTKPTDEQIAKAYAEMLAQEETKLPNQRSIEIGGIETTDDRAKRNVDEVGSNEPDKIYQDAKFWDRVGDKFISENDPTSVSGGSYTVCDGDIWYDTSS